MKYHLTEAGLLGTALSLAWRVQTGKGNPSGESAVQHWAQKPKVTWEWRVSERAMMLPRIWWVEGLRGVPFRRQGGEQKCLKPGVSGRWPCGKPIYFQWSLLLTVNIFMVWGWKKGTTNERDHCCIAVVLKEEKDYYHLQSFWTP